MTPARGKSTIVFLLFALDFLAASPLFAAETRKTTFSYSAVSMTWFPVKVAVEKGFFRNEGLDPQRDTRIGAEACRRPQYSPVIFFGRASGDPISHRLKG